MDLRQSGSRTQYCTAACGVKCQTAPRLTYNYNLQFQGPHSTNCWCLWYQPSLLRRRGPGGHPSHLLLQPAPGAAGPGDGSVVRKDGETQDDLELTLNALKDCDNDFSKFFETESGKWVMLGKSLKCRSQKGLDLHANQTFFKSTEKWVAIHAM